MPPVPPLPPIPELMKPGITPRLFGKIVRSMRSRSDINTKPEKEDIGFDSTSRRISRASTSAAKSNPALKLRISNPELRMPAQPDSTAVTDIPPMGMATSDMNRSHGRTYSGTSSLSNLTRSESLPTAYTIAKPRLSPMEYARRYLLKKASTNRNDHFELPAPRCQWFWTPQWDQFLIIPRIPLSIDRNLHMSCTKSNDRTPFAPPEETRKAESLVVIRDMSSALRHPRLSFNLQGVSALLPSVMNLISLGSSVEDNPLTPPKRQNTAVTRFRPPEGRLISNIPSHILKVSHRESLLQVIEGESHVRARSRKPVSPRTEPGSSPALPPFRFPGSFSESIDLATQADAEATYYQVGGIKLPECRRVAHLVNGISIASLRISAGVISPIKSVYSSSQDDEWPINGGDNGQRYSMDPAPLTVRRQRRASLNLPPIKSPTPTRTGVLAKRSGSPGLLAISPSTPSFRSLGAMLKGASGLTPKSRKPGEHLKEPQRPDSPTIPEKGSLKLKSMPRKHSESPRLTPTRIPRRSVADRQATPYRPRVGASVTTDSSPLQKYVSMTPGKPNKVDDTDVPTLPKTPNSRIKSTFAGGRNIRRPAATILPDIKSGESLDSSRTKTSSSTRDLSYNSSQARKPADSGSLLKYSPRQLNTPAATFSTLFRKQSRPSLASTTPKTPTTPTANWRPFDDDPGPLSPWHFTDDDPEYRSPTPKYGGSQKAPSSYPRNLATNDQLEKSRYLSSPRRLQLARESQTLRGIRSSGRTLGENGGVGSRDMHNHDEHSNLHIAVSRNHLFTPEGDEKDAKPKKLFIERSAAWLSATSLSTKRS